MNPTPAPTQIPTNADPRLMALLQARARMAVQQAPGAGNAPNGLALGAPPQPANPAAASVGARPPAAGANPAAAVMKAAQTAQSPLVADNGTRQLAKALISKLLQHM